MDGGLSSIASEAYETAKARLTQLNQWYRSQSPLKRWAVCFIAGLCVVANGLLIWNLGALFRFYAWIGKNIRESRYGAAIIWFGIVIVSFPPLVGFAGLCTFTGIAYGVTFKLWFLVTSACAVGSTLSFLIFKHLLALRSKKLLESSKLFLAFSTVLGQDKNRFLLLCLLQLCPRPYSLTNAAFGSIPLVDAVSFLISGVLVSPKYLLLMFMGYKMEHMGEVSDFWSRAADVLSIGLSGLVAVVTSYLIYRKTTQILQELGAEEAETTLLGEIEDV